MQNLPSLAGPGVTGKPFLDCLSPSIPAGGSVRIVCMSDTHNRYDDPSMVNVPSGDILLHAGDATMQGHVNELVYFNHFLESLDIPKQIFVPGNHDLSFDLKDKRKKALALVSHPHVALGWKHPSASITLDTAIGPLKIYGEPRQPWFYNWAFNWPRDKMGMLWEAVPNDVDILVTHGPPLGAGDRVENGNHVGCEFLRKWIEDVQPKLVVCGHIHPGYGIYTIGKTIVVNASLCNSKYAAVNPPIVITLTGN